MAVKNGGKMIFWEKSPEDSADTLGVKNFTEVAPSYTLSEINVFLGFFCVVRRNSRWPPKMAGKHFLGKVSR